jgi:hypothetical protein
MDMGLGGAATAVKLVGASAKIDIKGNRIVGDYSQACIAGTLHCPQKCTLKTTCS